MNSRLLTWSLLAALCLAIGDQTRGQPADPPARPGNPLKEADIGKRSMILLLKTEPDINVADFKITLRTAITQSGCKCANLETLDPVPISQVEYEAIDRFIKGFKSSQDRNPVKKSRGELLTIKKPVLIISKEEATDDLTELEVEYHQAGKITYKPKPRGTPGEHLTVMTGMEYQLELKNGDYPKAYTAKFVDKMGNDRVPLHEDLPSKRYFYLTLEDFEGKLDALGAKFRDDTIFINPASFTPTTRQTFVLADFSEDDPTAPGPSVSPQNITHRVEQRRGKGATRVWMQFPLTQDEAKAELERYRDPAKFGVYGLPKGIRDSKNTVEAGKMVTIKPGIKAMWYEIKKSDDSNEFVREMKIENAPELRKSYPDVYYLVMWEFEPVGAPGADRIQEQAIAVKDPDSKEKRKVFVLMRKVEGWSDGLDKPGGTPPPK